MARLLFGTLALAAAVAAPGSLWAEDAKSDSEIARAIVTALKEKQDAGELSGFHIGVSVDHGDVWMNGDVATREHQSMVLEIARHVPGVLQVVNDLKVISPESTSPPSKKPQADEKSRPHEKPQEAKKPQPHEKPRTFVAPASADMTASTSPDSSWQPRGKRIADRIVESIKSKQKAGELTGFDVVVCLGFGNAVYLQGKVANEKTREALLKTVRNQPEIHFVHDLTQIAEEETKLPDKATSRASNVPSFRSRQELPWDDGWWQLDFKAKKHR
jgi:osmotically-inducible protein OsmY